MKRADCSRFARPRVTRQLPFDDMLSFDLETNETIEVDPIRLTGRVTDQRKGLEAPRVE